MPTVMITGANRGLGLEFVRQYAEDGWSVVATCRNPIGVGELARLEGDIAVYGLDVDDPRSIERLVGDLKGQPIDVLVNNAGVHGPRLSSADEVTIEDWIPVMRTNAMSPLMLSRALIDNVAASEQKKIVNISSVMGSIERMGGAGEYIYQSSKAALNMVMANYASEVGPRGVTVVLFHPGWVETDMGGPSATLTPAQSIRSLKDVISRLTPDDNGKYMDYDGTAMPW